MRSGRLPDVPELFFAVDVAWQGKAAVSATGVADRLDRARQLCAGEMIERLTVPADTSGQDDITGSRVSARGSASGATAHWAEERAVLEAIERLAGRLWWSGRLASSAPSLSVRFTARTWLGRWQRRTPRQTEILELPLTRCARVAVAVSSGGDGRDICIGLAARRTGAAAARAAIKELLQMEFGLQVIRYRARHGITLSGREKAVLERAAGLARADCRPLLQARRPARDVEPDQESSLLADKLRREGYAVDLRLLQAGRGLMVATASVARNWPEPPPQVPGSWKQWPLYA